MNSPPFSTISKWLKLFLPGDGAIRPQRNGEYIVFNKYSATRGDMCKTRNCDSARTYLSKHPISSRVLMIRNDQTQRRIFWSCEWKSGKWRAIISVLVENCRLGIFIWERTSRQEVPAESSTKFIIPWIKVAGGVEVLRHCISVFG